MAWTHFEATPELGWEKRSNKREGYDRKDKKSKLPIFPSRDLTFCFCFSLERLNVTDCNRSCTCDSFVGGNFYRQYPEISLKLKSNKIQKYQEMI